MVMVTAQFHDWLEKTEEDIRKSAGRPPLDAECGEDFKKHVVTGHTGQKIRCYTCQGTDRAPIPWNEVMQHG